MLYKSSLQFWSETLAKLITPTPITARAARTSALTDFPKGRSNPQKRIWNYSRIAPEPPKGDNPQKWLFKEKIPNISPLVQAYSS